MKIVFLDTNILIHFTSIEQIPWREELQTDEFVIVIAKVVIDELDKHKRSTKSRIANRVRAVIKDLLEIENGGNFKGRMPIQIQLKKPAQAIYIDHELDKDEADDRLLAAILEYKSDNPEADVYLVTDDAGSTLKGRLLGISILSLNEKYLLKEEDDQIKQLQKEIIELKNAKPVLNLVFPDGSKVLNHSISASNFEKFAEEYIAKLRQDYPLVKQDVASSEYEKIILRTWSPLNFKTVDEYNYQIEKFYREYEDYLFENVDHFRKVHLTIKLDLKLINTGTAAADDIDVDIEMQNIFDVEKSAPKLDDKWEPRVPSKPGRRELDEDNSQYQLVAVSRNPPISLKGKGYPGIQKGETCKVNFDIESLKHGQEFSLKEIYLTFRSYEEVKGFQIKYTISVRNLTKHTTGVLNVNIVMRKS